MLGNAGFYSVLDYSYLFELFDVYIELTAEFGFRLRESRYLSA